MIEEAGRVVEFADDIAWVETERKTTCGNCSANKGCGSAVLASVLGQRRTRVRVLNTLPARLGDEVIIGLQENALVRGSLAIYAVPLLCMLGFALLAELVNTRLELTGTEVLNIAFGLAGLALGFSWLRRYAARIAKDPCYQPVILRHAPTAHLATLPEPLIAKF